MKYIAIVVLSLVVFSFAYRIAQVPDPAVSVDGGGCGPNYPTVPFSGNTSTRISKVVVGDGGVYGITFFAFYDTNGNYYPLYTVSFVGPTTDVEFVLNNGEYLTQMGVRYGGNLLNGIQFTTNTERSSGWIAGSEYNSEFELSALEIVGFYGYYCGSLIMQLISAIARVAEPTYIGCLLDGPRKDLAQLAGISPPSVSIENCQTYCGVRGYLYAGLQNGTQCNCGNSFGRYGKVSNEASCSIPCSGAPSDLCGGVGYNSIYATQSYNNLGCYNDQDVHDLPFLAYEASDNSVAKCVSTCELQNYTYAGVQFGKQCFCGNSFGTYGIVSDDSCHMSCSGLPEQICGGPWYNSVYEV